MGAKSQKRRGPKGQTDFNGQKWTYTDVKRTGAKKETQNAEYKVQDFSKEIRIGHGQRHGHIKKAEVRRQKAEVKKEF